MLMNVLLELLNVSIFARTILGASSVAVELDIYWKMMISAVQVYTYVIIDTRMAL